MIANQVALLRRELWEHRSILVTPLVIGLIVALLSVTGHVSVSTMGEAVDLAILSVSNLGENERAAVLNLMLISVSSLLLLAMGVLTVFYTLDALYGERKDRSILFWRSMPVTDAETVISKLLTAFLVIPLVTFAVIVLTHVVVLAMTSIWVAARGGNGWHLIWSAAPLLDNWTATLVFTLAIPLWLSPFGGWFLLVSAYTKRSPLLVAFLPIALLPMLERSLLGSTAFAEAFFVRSVQPHLFSGAGAAAFLDKEEGMRQLTVSGISLTSMLDLQGFLSSANLWLGLLVCGLFVSAAIYVRRYRDDS